MGFDAVFFGGYLEDSPKKELGNKPFITDGFP
jgi:hypothetical protein